jgi:hypothetical protein
MQKARIAHAQSGKQSSTIILSRDQSRHFVLAKARVEEAFGRIIERATLRGSTIAVLRPQCDDSSRPEGSYKFAQKVTLNTKSVKSLTNAYPGVKTLGLTHEQRYLYKRLTCEIIVQWTRYTHFMKFSRDSDKNSLL